MELGEKNKNAEFKKGGVMVLPDYGYCKKNLGKPARAKATLNLATRGGGKTKTSEYKSCL